MIVKGEQYYIPIKIKQGDGYLTPDDVEDVRVQIDKILKTYSDAELIFADNEWLYPMSQNESYLFGDLVYMQVGVKEGTEIRYSQPMMISVSNNIIMKEW